MYSLEEINVQLLLLCFISFHLCVFEYSHSKTAIIALSEFAVKTAIIFLLLRDGISWLYALAVACTPLEVLISYLRKKINDKFDKSNHS